MISNKAISAFGAAAMTTLTVQQSIAATAVDCDAIHKGFRAEYVQPPASAPEKLGKVLKLTFSGDAALHTGIDSITFSLAASKVFVATPKYGSDTKDKNVSIYSLKDHARDIVPNEHYLQCALFKNLFFSCARAQQYEPSMQNAQPNTIFSGAVKYKLGPVENLPACEGTILAPALK